MIIDEKQSYISQDVYNRFTEKGRMMLDLNPYKDKKLINKICVLNSEYIINSCYDYRLDFFKDKFYIKDVSYDYQGECTYVQLMPLFRFKDEDKLSVSYYRIGLYDSVFTFKNEIIGFLAPLFVISNVISIREIDERCERVIFLSKNETSTSEFNNNLFEDFFLYYKSCQYSIYQCCIKNGFMRKYYAI